MESDAAIPMNDGFLDHDSPDGIVPFFQDQRAALEHSRVQPHGAVLLLAELTLCLSLGERKLGTAVRHFPAGL